ncbi:helix-turn-helix domain-containing protein [Streptomyces sp. NPDC054961]
MFRVSLKAVDGWWAKWLAGGRDALTARPRGKRVGRASGAVRGRAGGPSPGGTRSPPL